MQVDHEGGYRALRDSSSALRDIDTYTLAREGGGEALKLQVHNKVYFLFPSHCFLFLFYSLIPLTFCLFLFALCSGLLCHSAVQNLGDNLLMLNLVLPVSKLFRVEREEAFVEGSDDHCLSSPLPRVLLHATCPGRLLDLEPLLYGHLSNYRASFDCRLF